MAELLFWPALLGYGEAAIAYSNPRYTRLAIWGVRVGWVAQTALLCVQAARVDAFPVVDVGRFAQPLRLARSSAPTCSGAARAATGSSGSA